jgi:glycosyltransferase involved in cell wall biosynthesis
MSQLRVCFLVENLPVSGGVGAIVSHARGLAVGHGAEVTCALTVHQLERSPEHDLKDIEVIGLAQARRRSYDVVIATWWQTAYEVFTVPGERRAFFIQSLEDRFYGPDRPQRAMAAAAVSLPVSFITEAGWIRDTLARLRPDAPCRQVRNGIDKEVFAIPNELAERREGPLRVLVEGLPAFAHKGIGDAIAALERMREPFEATFVVSSADGFDGFEAPPGRVVGPLSLREMSDLYASTDVVLKTSRVEGVYGPPLEGFHRGATCVTTPVTGHEEYIRHRHNAIVVDWDDYAGTARWLDTLALDRELLQQLRLNAIATAREWPSWQESTAEFAAALRGILDEPAPPAGVGASYAGGVLRTHIAELARSQRRLIADADWMLNVRDSSAAELLARWRREGGSGSQLATAAASAGARRIRRRLGGGARGRRHRDS